MRNPELHLRLSKKPSAILLRALAALVCLIVCVSLTPLVAGAGEREFAGLTLPQPKGGSPLQPDGRRRWPTKNASAQLRFEIDTNGKVDELKIDCLPRDTGIFYPYRRSLEELRFEPARYTKKKIPFTLFGSLIVRSMRSAPPELILPLNERGEFRSYDLAARSAEVNGVRLPRVSSFPLYYYVEPPLAADSGSLPDLAVVRVELDERGSALGRELVYASDSVVGDMVLIASGWAEYQPAEYQDNPVASSLLLVVRCFTELSYPTKVWRGDGPVDSDRVLDFQRVRSFADAPLIVLDPEIRLETARVFVNGADSSWQSIIAHLSVRKTGTVDLGRIEGTGSWNASGNLRSRLSALRVYPALAVYLAGDGSLAGLDTLFSSGALHIQALDSLSLRVETEFQTVIR